MKKLLVLVAMLLATATFAQTVQVQKVDGSTVAIGQQVSVPGGGYIAVGAFDDGVVVDGWGTLPISLDLGMDAYEDGTIYELWIDVTATGLDPSNVLHTLQISPPTLYAQMRVTDPAFGCESYDSCFAFDPTGPGTCTALSCVISRICHYNGADHCVQSFSQCMTMGFEITECVCANQHPRCPGDFLMWSDVPFAYCNTHYGLLNFLAAGPLHSAKCNLEVQVQKIN
jgi:hypothetical protein